MIDPKEFYKNDKKLNAFEKRFLYKRIKTKLKNNSGHSTKLQFRSFIYGFSAAAAIFLTFFLYWNNNLTIAYKDQPLDGLNHIYKKAIIDVENNFHPSSFHSNDQKTKDLFLAKTERLNDLSKAIKEIKSEKAANYTKEKILLRLYKQKLEILEKIILLEERIK